MKILKKRLTRLENVTNCLFKSDVDVFITIRDILICIPLTVLLLITFYFIYVFCIILVMLIEIT